ncbi:MAG: alanine racemase, partial [Lachnospiraceae bacterium]|nr:alanine racemase [Lachnospiraceae bacterium]
GGTYKVTETKRVATIPVGYADGYPRQLSNKGYVLIRGKKAPILGRVCMDQFMVDVTDIPEASQKDEVVLVGSQGDEHISVEELGALSGRFNYEFVCDIGKRVPRCFMKNGICVEQTSCFD